MQGHRDEGRILGARRSDELDDVIVLRHLTVVEDVARKARPGIILLRPLRYGRGGCGCDVARKGEP